MQPSSYREHSLRKQPKITPHGGVAPTVAVDGSLTVQAHVTLSPCKRLATGVTGSESSSLLPLVDHAILLIQHGQKTVNKHGLSPYRQLEQGIRQLLFSPPFTLALIGLDTRWVKGYVAGYGERVRINHRIRRDLAGDW
jgi:hypothetical protein